VKSETTCAVLRTRSSEPGDSVEPSEMVGCLLFGGLSKVISRNCANSANVDRLDCSADLSTGTLLLRSLRAESCELEGSATMTVWSFRTMLDCCFVSIRKD
jgi:hypothetical protein